MEEEEEGGVRPVWPLNDVVKAKNASAEYVPSLRRSARSSPRRNRRLNYRARLFSVRIFIPTPLSHTLSLLPPRPRSLSQMSPRRSTSSRCPHSSNRIRRGEGRIYLDLEPKDANARLQKSFTIVNRFPIGSPFGRNLNFRNTFRRLYRTVYLLGNVYCLYSVRIDPIYIDLTLRRIISSYVMRVSRSNFTSSSSLPPSTPCPHPPTFNYSNLLIRCRLPRRAQFQ